MKKAFTIIALLLAGAVSWAQTTLREGMSELEGKYGIHFVYDASLKLDVPARADAARQAASLDAALGQLFSGQGLRYEVKGDYVLLRKARRFTVSGTVTDVETGETLIGAGIFSGKNGVVTNSYGFYSLTLTEGETELSVSHIGYAHKRMRIKLDGNRTLDITLVPDATITAAEVTDWKEAGIGAVGLGSQEIPQSVIRRAPMLFGEADVMKSLQMLPGVQSGYSGSAGISIRGGGADENLLMLDGIPIYNGEHLLGLFSVFAPESVKKVTLYKSSFPARYGGRTSGIVDVRMNDGNSEGLHGSVTAGMLTEKAHLEGPLGEKTTFSLTGRVMHTGLVDLIGRPLGLETNYLFYDFHAKISHRIDADNRIFAGIYHGRDRFRQGFTSHYYYHYYDRNYAAYDRYTDDVSHFHMNWGNTVAGLRWNHIFNGRLFSNTTVSWSGYRSDLQAMNELWVDDDGWKTYSRSDFRYFTAIGDLSLRTDFEYTPSPSHAVKFGAGVTRHVFVPDGLSLAEKQAENGTTLRDTVLSHYSGTYMPGTEASAYLEDEISIGRKLTLNPGLHFALFTTMGKAYPSFQPRFSVRWDVSPAVVLKAGYSRMAQYVHLLPFARINLPTDTWVPITDRIPPQTSDQWSAGCYYTGLSGWSISSEVYYKSLQNIVELRSNRLAFAGADQWEQSIATGIGRAYGTEWMVEKTAGRLTGWLSYTLSWSERCVPDGSVNEGRWFPYTNDRRHKVSLYAEYSPNERIDFSAAWLFASGNRMTVPTRHMLSLGEEGFSERLYIPSRNNWTAPPTHRLDVSVNFRKKKPRGERIWNVGVYNLYAARNPDYLQARKNGWHVDPNDPAQAKVLDYDNIPEGRIYVMMNSILTVIPSFSYTRTF